MNDELSVRPYLGRARHTGSSPQAALDDVGVRPYYLTRGRTRGADSRIGFETLLVTTVSGFGALGRVGAEHRQILALATSTVSVAEISARLHIPIGVARVLSGDLATEGLLDLHATPVAPSKDIPLIARLINGIRAL